MSSPETSDPHSTPATFRIDRDGVWRHEGQEVTHPGVVRNLYANLHADATGHYLQVGPARIPVEVDDAPFIIIRVESRLSRGEIRESLRVRLNDGSEEPLVVQSLWIGARGTPYCRVKSDRFVARLSIPAWLQLAPLLAEEGAGAEEVILVVGGQRVSLPKRG